MRVGSLCTDTYLVKVRSTKAERARAQAKGTELKGRTQARYRARYRIYLPGTKPREVKQGGFSTKGLADTFLDTVRWAAIGHEGWCFDDDFKPVAPSTAAAVLPEVESCLALCEDYWNIKWESIGASRRRKIRGRLLTVVAGRTRERRPSGLPGT